MPYTPEHYQHQLDRDSLLNLRAIKWFERLSKFIVADDLERDFHLLNLVDNVQMTRRDFPRPLEHLEHACAELGVQKTPALFLDTNPVAHTLCVGEREPLIVMSSGMLELLTDEELAAAIAHEVGHVACRHAYYKLLAENFGGVAQLANVVPGLSVAAFTVKMPLYDWYRKADLTADRAALLVMRDTQPLLRMIGKIAGGSGQLASQISLESLLEQARQTRETVKNLKTGNLRQKVSYFFSNLVMQGMFRTQPWPAIRVLEIQEWAETDHCKDLLAGKTPSGKEPPERAANERSASFFRTWTDAVTSAGRSFMPWGKERDEGRGARDEGGEEGTSD